MKNLFKRTLALILAMLTVFSIGIVANAFSTPEVYWEFDEETGNLTIMSDVPDYENSARAEWVNIRNGVKSITVEHGVKSLGNYAFGSLTKVEKVELPQTLESIGSSTFRGLSRVTEIDLPQRLTSIGEYAFNSCHSLTDITIPAKVKYIYKGTFGFCSNLQNVEITGSRTIVWEKAFLDCRNLKTLKIAEGSDFNGAVFGEQGHVLEAVYYTGSEESYKAMYAVKNGYLQSKIIYYNQPATPYVVSVSIASMPDKMRYEPYENLDLTGLTLKVVMNDGTTFIDSELSDLHAESGTTGKSNSSYYEYRVTYDYCGHTVAITFIRYKNPSGTCEGGAEWYLDKGTGILTISGSGEMDEYTKQEKAPWSDYSSYIKTVKIEEGIESVDNYAFYGCYQIETVYLPSSLQSIRFYAFKDKGIKSIYYSGTAEDWRKINTTNSSFVGIALYFNNELHEHSYTITGEITREPTCTSDGSKRIYCECGDYVFEKIPTVEHTHGEWETLSSGKTVKKCTVCSKIVEEKEEVEELPEDEVTQPEETTTEEATQPEETITEEENTEPEEESSVFEKIAYAFEEIIGAITSVFSKIAEWFTF